MYKFTLPVFLLLGFLVVTGRGMGQELKNGYYPDGKIRYQGYFVDGKPVGEFIRYSPEGSVSAKMNYRGDTVEAVLYSRNSEYSSAGKFVRQKKCGLWEYRRGKEVVMREEYDRDLLDGKMCRYGEDERLLEQKFWKQGMADGEWSLFFGNGQLRVQTYFCAGKLNGGLKSYFPEGQLRTKGEYKNNLKEGEWEFYDETGKLLKKQVYHLGIAENAEEQELEESRQLDALIQSGKVIPDPARFADDPEAYMQITGME